MQICGFAASGGPFSGKYAGCYFFFCRFKGRVGLGQRCSCVTCPTMTSAQVVKMLVTINNSPIEEYTHSDNHIQSTHNIIAELN